MKKKSMKWLGLIICLVLLFQLFGCGTLIYPERRGQVRGDIDPGVAVLDAVGLLFFVVPGLVAFIVDFTTGAIYLPPGKSTEERLHELKGSDLYFKDADNGKVVYFDPGTMTPERLEQIIKVETGIVYNKDDPNLVVYRYEDVSALNRVFQGQDNYRMTSTIK